MEELCKEVVLNGPLLAKILCMEVRFVHILAYCGAGFIWSGILLAYKAIIKEKKENG